MKADSEFFLQDSVDYADLHFDESCDGRCDSDSDNSHLRKTEPSVQEASVEDYVGAQGNEGQHGDEKDFFNALERGMENLGDGHK